MSQRGGKRKGAGRKPGSGKGRKAISSSITMLPETWQKLDTLRGEKTRSKWVQEKVTKAKI